MAINLNERSVGPLAPGEDTPALAAIRTNDLLEEIRDELKILNIHMSLTTDQDITTEDL